MSGDGSSELAIQSASASPWSRSTTDSLTHEIQAPVTGILSKILVKDGGSVEPGTVMGTIDQV
jgi:biotin carboxyl carrier protein